MEERFWVSGLNNIKFQLLLFCHLKIWLHQNSKLHIQIILNRLHACWQHHDRQHLSLRQAFLCQHHNLCLGEIGGQRWRLSQEQWSCYLTHNEGQFISFPTQLLLGSYIPLCEMGSVEELGKVSFIPVHRQLSKSCKRKHSLKAGNVAHWQNVHPAAYTRITLIPSLVPSKQRVCCEL